MADDSADVAAGLGKVVLGAAVGFGLYLFVTGRGPGTAGAGDGSGDGSATPSLQQPSPSPPPLRVAQQRFVVFVGNRDLVVAPLASPARVHAFVLAHPDALRDARDPNKPADQQPGKWRTIDEIASTSGGKKWPYDPLSPKGASPTDDEKRVTGIAAKALASAGARRGDALYFGVSGGTSEGNADAFLRAFKRTGFDLYTGPDLEDNVRRARLDEIPQGAINGKWSPVLGPSIGYARRSNGRGEYGWQEGCG